ncbi:glucokinase [Candidatus Woesearchaeota archaeon]|nr:glucokinase [Candidatus Woesearchaeota archaeon]
MGVEKRFYGAFAKNSYNSFILGGDIGGTNTSIGLFGIKNNKSELIVSFHFKTKELEGFYQAVNESLDYIQAHYKISIKKACFAVAGVLSRKKDFAETQNVPWSISKKGLSSKTKLKKIMLLNDFEAIGYGINMLKNKDTTIIKKGQKISQAPIVVIGAGTGLGKTTLIYDEHLKAYIPLTSEAGHSDFAAQSKEELDLINFIKKFRKIKTSISFEHVLSGQGLSDIYLFLRKSKKFPITKYTKEIDKAESNPILISKYKNVDKTCKATFEMFKKIYARSAKGFALDALAYGGVYIAGGIAMKNPDILDKNFVKEFENNYKLSFVLRKIPIYLIKNYNVGLLGAGFVGARFL